MSSESKRGVRYTVKKRKDLLQVVMVLFITRMIITEHLLKLNKGCVLWMSESFSNKVLAINSSDIEPIKMKFESNEKIFVVELNGANILSWKAYISEIQSKFRFPTSCVDSWDRYLDWMRDLEWLNKEEFVLIINQASLFLKNDLDLKKQIICDFVDVILPFWEDEVKVVVVGGKAKSFMVYLVD